ncbi:MAG: hypothetical protein K9J79_09090, partial [Desulfobacteraceae bacterium]|nr:hypothetical protein [Desulfobacteraceae bacterium]
MLVLLLGLPLAGAWILGDLPLRVYFDFPPEPGLISHAQFSRPVFTGLAALIAACAAPFLWRAVRVLRRGKKSATVYKKGAFPLWGWLG